MLYFLSNFHYPAQLLKHLHLCLSLSQYDFSYTAAITYLPLVSLPARISSLVCWGRENEVYNQIEALLFKLGRQEVCEYSHVNIFTP